MSVFLVHPGMLWTAAIAAAIVVLHLLLPRWKRRVVPSLMIWRRVAARGTALSARRLSWDLVLVLAALAAACMVLAAADVRLVTARTARDEVVLVVDNATSSLSEGVAGATRLDDALAAARRELARLSADGRAALVTTSPEAGLVAGFATPAEIARSFALIRRTNVSGDIDSALALAFATGSPAAELLVFGSRAATSLPPRARRVPVGAPSRNLAFVRAEFGPDRAFSALRNYGARDVTTVVAMRVIDPMAPGDCARQTVTVRALGRADLVLVPAGPEYAAARTVRIAHAHADDDLDVDDAVFATRLPPPARRVRVVGEASEPLVRALRAAGAEIVYARDDAAGTDDADLDVFAGVTPRVWPSATFSVVVNPPQSFGTVELLERELVDVAASFVSGAPDGSPIAGFPAAATVRVERASRVRFFGAHEPLMVGGGEALVAILRDGPTPHVYVGFDPAASDWPVQSSFPVFVARVLEAAGGEGVVGGRLAFARVGGAAADVVPLNVTALAGPRGVESTPQARLELAGLYAMRTRADRDGSAPLAVNLVSERESDNTLAPPESAPAAGDGGGLAAVRGRFESSGLSGALCAAALALCLAEWVLGARRG
jgi:hypothetical protein